MNKIPAIWKENTSTDLTKEQTRELGFQDKLANLRKATGRPETIELPMRCSVTGKQATLIYSRMHAGEKFKLAQTIKGDNRENSGGFFDGLLSRKTPALRFDASEIDSTGRACPYCGDERYVVDCANCHQATCGGNIRILDNGEEQHTCHPDCGHVTLVGTATHVNGNKADRRGVLAGGDTKALTHQKQTPRLPVRSTKALPKAGVPLLGGPKKK